MVRVSAIIIAVLLFQILSPVVASSSGQKSDALPEVLHPLVYRQLSLSSPGSPPFTPSDIRKAYDFLPLYARGVKGNGTRIAIVDAYGDPNLSSDLTSFNSLTGLPSLTLNIFYPDGPPRRTDSGWALETALDVEWAHSIAPSATIDLVVTFDSALGHVFDGISYVANSLPSEKVMSMSFGLPELSYPTTGSFTIAAHHQLFVTITSHGTIPFASSGDSGASSCCNPQYPASDPLVTAVGGTSLTLNSDSSYGSETTWSGSGAGSSTIYSKPTWQKGLGDGQRDVVDVSYDGDLNTGVLVVQGGVEFQVGGTSAGAPQWAGLMDLASQANGQSYGAINRKLYNLTSYHDVTTGSDTFFSAGSGWDYPTGLGTPDAAMIVDGLSPSLQVSLNNTALFGGFTVTTRGSIGILSAGNSLFGSPWVVVRNGTTGTVLFNKNYTISNVILSNSTGTLHGAFLLNIAIGPFPLSDGIVVKDSSGIANASIVITRSVDVNGDGKVNILDLAFVANSFGATLGSSRYDGRADIDGNGVVNITDLAMIAFYFNDQDFL